MSSLNPLTGGLSLLRPSPAQQPGAPRRTRLDPTTWLSLLVVLAVVIPAQLVVGPLGAAGTPAKILGCLMLLWWGFDRLIPGLARPLDTPIRKALFVFGLAVLASYGAGASRPMTGTEQRSADRMLISLVSWFGISLFVGVVNNRDRLEALLRRVVLMGGALGAFGILQFLTGETWVDRISIPGLVLNSDIFLVGDRSGFVRPAGTATSPIEFGVVLTVVLPLAIHYALHDRERRWYRRMWPAMAIGFAVPISISRSAILGATVALLIVLPTWPGSRRRMAYLVLLLGSVGVYLTVPGLLGSISGMFTGAGNDPSVQSRTDSYGIALRLFGQSPVFGRGLGTFIPSYRIVDNQFLGTLVEMGVVGLGIMLALFLVTIVTIFRMRRRAHDARQRDLAVAVAASIAAGVSGFMTFDAFAFPMLTSLLFLMLGCADSLYRHITNAAFDDGGGGRATVAGEDVDPSGTVSEGRHGVFGPVTGRLMRGSLRHRPGG